MERPLTVGDDFLDGDERSKACDQPVTDGMGDERSANSGAGILVAKGAIGRVRILDALAGPESGDARMK